MRLDRLSALDSLGEGVLKVVGSLMNRIGSVGIEGIVSLQTLWLASGSRTRTKQTDRATPIGGEVIHGGGS